MLQLSVAQNVRNSQGARVTAVPSNSNLIKYNYNTQIGIYSLLTISFQLFQFGTIIREIIIGLQLGKKTESFEHTNYIFNKYIKA